MDSRRTNDRGSLPTTPAEPAAVALSRLRRKSGGPSPMLIVLGVVGVGLLVAVCGFGKFVLDGSEERTRRAVAKTKTGEISEALLQYHLVNDEFPVALHVLTEPDPANQGKPYLSAELILDPWRQPFQYDRTGPHHQGELPDVYSVRPDGTILGNWK